MSRLTNLLDYDFKNNIIFSNPRVEKIPGIGEKGKSALTYQRILISTKFSDGSEGDLIFATPGDDHFSYGLGENTSPETGKVTGHSLPICLYNKDGPTDNEKKWVAQFNEVMEFCKEHLVTVQQKLGIVDLEVRDLKKFNPLFYKKEKNKESSNFGKVIEGAGPIFYAKTWESKGKICTVFHELYYEGSRRKTRLISDPTTLTGTYCTVRAAFKFESIYIGGGKYSPQIKLYHVIAKTASHGPRSILNIEEEEEEVEESMGINPLLGPATETDIVDEDEKPKKTKKIVRKK
jgi:hypothetical protein